MERIPLNRLQSLCHWWALRAGETDIYQEYDKYNGFYLKKE